MITPKIEQLLSVASKKSYKIFDNDTKPFNINIWGIRNASRTPNAFDDTIVVFWKYAGNWNMRHFPATTDPGLYWLKNTLSKLGTGILKEAQIKGMWAIGKHQGTYTALVQKSKAIVIRDNDKDSEIDFDSQTTEEGIFGINCHRAAENGKSVLVDKWSAACQVIQNRQINNPDNQMVKVFEFDYFMHLCNQAAAVHGNSFTYTLVNEKDFEQETPNI